MRKLTILTLFLLSVSFCFAETPTDTSPLEGFVIDSYVLVNFVTQHPLLIKNLLREACEECSKPSPEDVFGRNRWLNYTAYYLKDSTVVVSKEIDDTISYYKCRGSYIVPGLNYEKIPTSEDWGKNFQITIQKSLLKEIHNFYDYIDLYLALASDKCGPPNKEEVEIIKEFQSSPITNFYQYTAYYLKGNTVVVERSFNRSEYFKFRGKYK